jgi:probable HAF family extracellular repeat protein
LSVAFDVNNDGLVVGSSYSADGLTHAFVVVPEDTEGDGIPDYWYRDDDGDGINDLMVDLNDLIRPDRGLHLHTARGINDRGQIVGMGRNANGEQRAFRFTPGYTDETGVEVPACLENLGTLPGGTFS